MADDEKLFVVSNDLRHKFAKQGEWRVRNNDVGLFQKFDTLAAAEVSSTVDAVAI